VGTAVADGWEDGKDTELFLSHRGGIEAQDASFGDPTLPDRVEEVMRDLESFVSCYTRWLASLLYKRYDVKYLSLFSHRHFSHYVCHMFAKLEFITSHHEKKKKK